jgi:glycosyltransferase involved in cell wall biosynthesis
MSRNITPELTVVICTRNRAEYLRKAIKSICDQDLSPGRFELLIVDNGSVDNTRSMIESEFNDVDNLKYIYEPIPGLSQARNTGLKHAKGKYVSYLDDDAVASPKWIRSMLETFSSVKPTPGCIGGKIDLIWETARPAWISDKMTRPLGYVYWSDQPIILNDKQWIGGGNIAFPKEVLESLGGFTTNLGRKGNKLLANEEIILINKLKADGYICYYHPDVMIYHYVSPDRVNKRWFYKRYYWQGVSNAVMLDNEKRLSISARYAIILKNILGIMIKPIYLLLALFTVNNPNNFEKRCSVISRVGYIAGLLKISG